MLNYSLMMNPNSVLPYCDTLVILDSERGLIFDSFLQRATSKDIALPWKRHQGSTSRLCKHGAASPAGRWPEQGLC